MEVPLPRGTEYLGVGFEETVGGCSTKEVSVVLDLALWLARQQYHVVPQSRLLTKTSSRHRLSSVGLVQPQQPLYAALVSVRLIQTTVRNILEIPFSASLCLALRKESETGACTQSNVSTSVSRTEVI